MKKKKFIGSYAHMTIGLILTALLATLTTFYLFIIPIMANMEVELDEKQIIEDIQFVEAVPASSPIEILEIKNEIVEEPKPIPEVEIIPYEEYTIQRGDTLWDIANKFYGNGKHYPWIEKCNNLYGENKSIIRGMVLRIYPLEYSISEEEIERNGYYKSISIRSSYLDIPYDPEVDKSNMTYYGNIHVTGYDPLCKHCCGKNDGITASGEKYRYYETVAMNNIPFGTKLYIEGYGYFIVNDRGGKTLGIDIACESHDICVKMSSPGQDVYIVND